MKNKKFLQKIQKVLSKGVAQHFENAKSVGAISNKLKSTLDLRVEGAWNSAYNPEPIELPSGETLTIRIADHQAKPEQFAQHFDTKYNVVLLIGEKTDDITVTTKVDSSIYSEILYKSDCFKGKNRTKTITEILEGLQYALETGEYQKGEMGEWLVMQVVNGLSLGDNETPLMKQYDSIKAKYPDAILLFRKGDSYVIVRNDAKVFFKITGVVYSTVGGLPFLKFPYTELDNYLPMLVRAGKRVAICEQLDSSTKKTDLQETTYDNKIVYFNRNAIEREWEDFCFSDPLKLVYSNNYNDARVIGNNRWGVQQEISVRLDHVSDTPVKLQEGDWCVYTFDKREAVSADLHRTYRILSISKDSAKLSDGTTAHSLSMLEYRPIHHAPAYNLGDKIQYKKGNILTSDGKTETPSKTSGEYEISAYRWNNNDVEYYLKPENYSFNPWVSEKALKEYGSKMKPHAKSTLKYFVIFDTDRDERYYPESWGCQVGLAKNKTEFIRGVKQYDRRWNTNYSRAWGTARELTQEELEEYIKYNHPLKDAELELLEVTDNDPTEQLTGTDDIFTQAFKQALKNK